MNLPLPKYIIMELRIVQRLATETLKGIKQTGIINIVIITTMAAILSIFGCMFRASMGLSTFINELGNTLEVSVYLKPGINPEKVSSKIKKLDSIKQVKIISKESAWNDLKQQMNVPNIKNPLPDTLRVKVFKPENVTKLATKIKKFTEVEDIQYPQQLAQKMQAVHEISRIATGIVLVFLGGLTMFIISNTIQLVIQSRKQEIEIMRLMGVNNWYIKSPYVIQGAFYGLFGSIFAIIPLSIVQGYIDKALAFFGVVSPAVYNNIVILCLLAMGIVFGAGGSVISVKKYLRV